MSKIKITDLVSKMKNENVFSHVHSNSKFTSSHSNIVDRVKISHLFINDETQRGIDKRRVTKIQKMATNFDPYKFGMPLVTQDNDGNYLVVDGQGRTIAAYLAGFTEIPCQKMIKPEGQSDLDWQGELFITQNDNVETVSGWQLYDVAHRLNQNGMVTHSGKNQVNRAKDITNLIDRLNKNDNNWTFGYHVDVESTINKNYTVDLTKIYKYVVDGIIRDTHNIDANCPAGSRRAKCLEAALYSFAEYLPNEAVTGQNLEVAVVYIKKIACALADSRNLTGATSAEVNDAAKRFCYILNNILMEKRSNNPSYKLTHADLKTCFGTVNKANNEVAEIGIQNLENLWKKITKSKNYSTSVYENKFKVMFKVT